MVPKPVFASFDDLNDYLADQCLKRMGDTLRRHKYTIGDRRAGAHCVKSASRETCLIGSGDAALSAASRLCAVCSSRPAAPVP